ncbi:MAG TPA: sulfotransferase [Steroidobacteraceae bacterium]|nr:sulfotransferase [Steroidobacteraceae bacterium]
MQQTDTGRVRAIILTTQRSGSTFLVDCLRSHPEVECSGEILNGLPDVPRQMYRGPFRQVVKGFRILRTGAWLPGPYLDAFFRRGTARVRCFKAMYNQLARPFAARYLVQNEDIRVIHLRRHNLLKVHVSTLLMDKRKQLQATAPTETVWIHVDPQKAVAAIRKAQAKFDAYDRQFSRHPLLQISYEKLIGPDGITEDARNRICEFLGIAQLPMTSPLVKLNPDSLRDMVTNYDELERAMRATEFAWMLD